MATPSNGEHNNSMIIGAGIDIVEICRVREAVEKWGKDFLSRIFTPREIAYSTARRFSYQHLAGKFAAKEACFKALGAPKRFPVKWPQIEVLNDADGKPTIVFHGEALKLKKSRRVETVIISLSHSKNYAVANAILLGKEKRG